MSDSHPYDDIEDDSDDPTYETETDNTPLTSSDEASKGIRINKRTLTTKSTNQCIADVFDFHINDDKIEEKKQ